MNKNLLSLSVILISVAGAQAASVPTPPALPNSVAAPQGTTLNVTSSASGAAKATPSYMSYSYYGERYRDPFIPLNGEFKSADTLDRPPQLSSLTLKGIVEDAKGRMALLNNGSASYLLRDGHLYDGRNRIVKKISGIIKPESVVLIGSDRTVRELKVRAEL